MKLTFVVDCELGVRSNEQKIKRGGGGGEEKGDEFYVFINFHIYYFCVCEEYVVSL